MVQEVGGSIPLGHPKSCPSGLLRRVGLLRLQPAQAPLAQLVEHRTLNPQVLGSSPRGCTKHTGRSQAVFGTDTAYGFGAWPGRHEALDQTCVYRRPEIRLLTLQLGHPRHRQRHRGEDIQDSGATAVKYSPLRVSNSGTTPYFDTLPGMEESDVQPSNLADWLLSQGRNFITTNEAAAVLGVSAVKVPTSLERAREAGKMISVTKGGWVPVPPAHRSAGAPPASHYIDQLMTHLDHPYYVGLLSAAAIHGASHQSPMVFQVATPAKLRERRIGRSRIQFLQRSGMAEKPREQHVVPTGRIWVSTPEVTVLDLVESPHDSGGLSNVATIIGDLLHDQKLHPDALASDAGLYASAIAQRAGYLIDLIADEVGIAINTEPLHRIVADTRYRRLSPGGSDGERDQRWHLIINTEIEDDL